MPIRLAWFGLTMPCLLLSYAGQCALLLSNTDGSVTASNVFFAQLPPALFWPLLVLAVVASLSASQGVLSGCFTLAAQAVRLHYLPQLQILHTSPKQYGQVRAHSASRRQPPPPHLRSSSRHRRAQLYLPLVNSFLWLTMMVVVVAAGNSLALVDAAGVAVTLVMLTDR
jgi:KUP system potassium uptake protein